MKARLNRRDFLCSAAVTAAGATIASWAPPSIVQGADLPVAASAPVAVPESPAAPGGAAADLEVIKLPPPAMAGGLPLMEAIKARKSTRGYRGDPLSPEQLSNLLWAGFGINRPETGHRTAPSAVNCQEIDIYVVLPEGAYVYEPKEHQLNPVAAGDFRGIAGNGPSYTGAPAYLLYVADKAKMGRVSEARRDLFSMAHAGFISQNVYLCCASEGLSTLLYESIDRAAMKEALGLRDDQTIVFPQVIGYPRA